MYRCERILFRYKKTLAQRETKRVRKLDENVRAARWLANEGPLTHRKIAKWCPKIAIKIGSIDGERLFGIQIETC